MQDTFLSLSSLFSFVFLTLYTHIIKHTHNMVLHLPITTDTASSNLSSNTITRKKTSRKVRFADDTISNQVHGFLSLSICKHLSTHLYTHIKSPDTLRDDRSKLFFLCIDRTTLASRTMFNRIGY